MQITTMDDSTEHDPTGGPPAGEPVLPEAAPGLPPPPQPIPQPTLQPLAPPPPSHPPPPAPPPLPGSSSPSSTPVGWVIVAIAVGVLAGVPALADTRTEGFAYAFGGFIGTLVLLAIVGGLVWRFASMRAGAVTVVILGVIVMVGNVARVSQESETQRQISDAADELGLEGDDVIEFTRAEADCLDRTGLDEDDILTALTDMGAAGSESQLAMFDAFSECAPRALLTDDSISGFQESFGMGVSGELPDDEARCILQRLTELPAPSAVLDGSDPAAMTDILEGCLSEETWNMIGGTDGSGPQAIGDDPQLDRFAELCRGGNDVACDVLYGLAAFGSEYADLSFDCAGRGLKSELSCLPGFVDLDENGFFDDDSPGWPDVLDACRAGDMLACDFTFDNAEIRSAAERLGETCGDRRAIAVGGTCVERYGETAD